MKAFLRFLSVVLFTAFPNMVSAELIDRGGGLIYDTVLDVTWLQDVNWAMTSGHHKDGKMTWPEAMEFVANLKYYDPVRKVAWDDWRLPTAKNRDGSGPDRGYYTRNSELGHMYYNNLGNRGLYPEEKNKIDGRDKSRGNPRTRKTPQEDYGLKTSGPFINLTLSSEFWTSTEAPRYSPKDDPRHPINAWDFFMNTGTQSYCDKWDHWFFAWPVRDGDVASLIEDNKSVNQ